MKLFILKSFVYLDIYNRRVLFQISEVMYFGNSDIIEFTMEIIKPDANSHSVILKMTFG